MSHSSLLAPLSDGEVKRSLVLSGGGMRLSYQAGALRALQEIGINFSHVDATSGGSLNASMLLSGLDVNEVCNRWETLDLKDTISFLPLGRYFDLEDLRGLGDADAMRKNMLPHLGIDLANIRDVKDVVGTYNVLDYGNKQVKVIPNSEIEEDMLIAGISLPGVFPPIEKEDEVYLDTAFIQDANVLEAVRRGAEEIWLIWGLGNTNQYRGGMLNIYIQMLEMSANGALNNEIAQLAQINDEIENGNSRFGQKQKIKLHVICPSLPLPLDPELYLGKISNATLIDMGYADAQRYLSNMDENGLELKNNITAMEASFPGIRFSEKLAGECFFEDIACLELQSFRQPVNLRVTFHINNLEKFIDANEHKGRLTGRIKFGEMQEEIILYDGIFLLFATSEIENSRKIQYQANFNFAGKCFRLAGEKLLHDDFGLDLWKDLSRLNLKIFELQGNQTEFRAEGNLKLEVSGIPELLKSVSATGVDSLPQSARVIAKFTRFFIGETADVYG